jgi:hypothetical protein
MALIKITETNGATAEDISDAIGEFLKQLEKDGDKPEPEKE